MFTPLQRYKEQAQVALDRIDFWAGHMTNFFSDDPDQDEIKLRREIRADLRSAGTLLNSKYVGISFRRALAGLGVIPKDQDLKAAYGKLILLSNNFPVPSRERGRTPEQSLIDLNSRAIDEIKRILAS